MRLLARHPLLPLDVLMPMAEPDRMGPDPLPRICAATPDELAELSASARPGVRMLVAQRRDLPARLRDALADDPDAAVAKAVASHPGLREDRLRAMVARYGVQVLARVAANPDAPPALLEDLVRHDPPARRVFREVVVHPNATEAALLPCLHDPKAQVHAARHPALSPPVLVDLLTHPSPDVAESAAANPSLPRAVMEELLARERLCVERRRRRRGAPAPRWPGKAVRPRGCCPVRRRPASAPPAVRRGRGRGTPRGT
ncbi:hypothetical protein [Streptomyces sp. NPDC054961]